MVFAFVVMPITLLLTFLLALRRSSCRRLAYLSECLLDGWHIGLIGVISDGNGLIFYAKNEILNSILERFVEWNILHNLVTAVLAVQIDIEYYGLLVRLCLCCREDK